MNLQTSYSSLICCQNPNSTSTDTKMTLHTPPHPTHPPHHTQKGFSLDHPWIILELSMDYIQIISGLFLYYSVIIHGFFPEFLRIIPRLSLDHLWIIPGFYLDYAWSYLILITRNGILDSFYIMLTTNYIFPMLYTGK